MTETIKIIGVGSELTGVGRSASGRTLFVLGAIPGELVKARVTREGDRFSMAEAVEILEPSPQRTVPPCPFFGRCGGCVAQHMDYALTLELKARRVTDALERIGGLKDVLVLPTIPSPDRWRYRNKAEYLCRNTPGGFLCGMSERGSRRVVELCDCLLQHPAGAKLLNAAHRALPKHAKNLVTRVDRSGQLMAIVGVQGDFCEKSLADSLFSSVPELVSLYRCDLKSKPAHAMDGPVSHIRGLHRLPEQLCGLDYQLSPHTFFQVNRGQAEQLIATLLRALDLHGSETVVDAYCGIGTLTLPLAQTAKRAIGIELVRPAVEDAVLAAEANGIKNVEFLAGDAPIELENLLSRGLRPNAVVVDPPRSGLDKRLIVSLSRVRPEKIAYVSCDPGTLARDLKLLLADGAYKLAPVQPLDMFPWTEHVETVVLMSRVDKQRLENPVNLGFSGF